MKRIKFPLVMKNGVEVRDIEGLRENFDIVAVVQYFFNGKLERWLENNYHEDILEAVKELDSNQEGFGQKLAEALGANWENSGEFDLQAVVRQTGLKEQLKPYVSEEELEEMEYIADTQQELERFARMGCSRVYLFGEQFCIPEWMKNMECIGINHPKICLDVKDRGEFKEKNVRLQEVTFVNEEMKKIALGDSKLDVYYGLLDVLELYLKNVQKTFH